MTNLSARPQRESRPDSPDPRRHVADWSARRRTTSTWFRTECEFRHGTAPDPYRRHPRGTARPRAGSNRARNGSERQQRGGAFLDGVLAIVRAGDAGSDSVIVVAHHRWALGQRGVRAGTCPSGQRRLSLAQTRRKRPQIAGISRTRSGRWKPPKCLVIVHIRSVRAPGSHPGGRRLESG
jgi:hypothetical protein